MRKRYQVTSKKFPDAWRYTRDELKSKITTTERKIEAITQQNYCYRMIRGKELEENKKKTSLYFLNRKHRYSCFLHRYSCFLHRYFST